MEVLNPDGTTAEFVYPHGYYTVILVLRGALDPLSSKRLESFCQALPQFYQEDVRICGVTRDSLTDLKNWISTIEVNFPLVSDMNISEEIVGVPQYLGVPLIDGYPVPTTFVLDKSGRVRYSESTVPELASVEEILRVIRALKTVDKGEGTRVTPADWIDGESEIRNTQEGVAEFYQEKYGESDDDDEDEEIDEAADKNNISGDIEIKKENVDEDDYSKKNKYPEPLEIEVAIGEN